MAEYKLIGRMTSGVVVHGYVLQDLRDGKIVNMSKEDTYRLALDKKISNVNAQLYNGKVNIRGIGMKVSKLLNYDMNGNIALGNNAGSQNKSGEKKAYLTGRYKEGRNIKGYRVAVYRSGVKLYESFVDRAKVMEYAKKGLIENVRYFKNQDMEMLRGVNCQISELPICTQ